jgi:hypothetical protein
MYSAIDFSKLVRIVEICLNGSEHSGGSKYLILRVAEDLVLIFIVPAHISCIDHHTLCFAHYMVGITWGIISISNFEYFLTFRIPVSLELAAFAFERHSFGTE